MLRAFANRLFATLFIAIPIRVSAQQVYGMVRDSTAGVPLPGAVILVLDSARATTARTVTDAGGRFGVERRPGSTRVRVLRLGFQPQEVALNRATGETRLTVSMVRIPPILATVHVADRELCPGSTDHGAAFQLWEQVRSGLLEQAVSNDAAVDARGLTFRRRVPSAGGIVRAQTVSVASVHALRPFVAAATPATFAERGYIEEDANGRVYRAPDADVLLDPTFIGTHCLRLQSADVDHVGQIGLAFSPAPGRDSLVDISGVIWIDQSLRELRSFDFHYTGLEPIAMRAEAGGHMTFQTASNGAAFIDQWIMRLPIVVAVVATPGQPQLNTNPSRRTRTDLRVAEIEEGGGLVLDARWADGTKWVAPPVGLSGQVNGGGKTSAGTSIVGAIISIDGTDTHVTSDSRGSFSFVPVPGGRYSVTIADTSLSDFAAPRQTTQIVEIAPSHVTPIQAVLESPNDVISGECRDRKRRPTAPIIAGNIRLLPGAMSRPTLSAAWNSPSGDSTVRIEFDSHGRFLLCDAPPDIPIALRIFDRQRHADTTVVVSRSIESIVWRPTLLISSPTRRP